VAGRSEFGEAHCAKGRFKSLKGRSGSVGIEGTKEGAARIGRRNAEGKSHPGDPRENIYKWLKGTGDSDAFTETPLKKSFKIVAGTHVAGNRRGGRLDARRRCRERISEELKE